MFDVHIKSKALRQLHKLDRKHQKRIAASIDELANDPYLGKRLEGNLSGYFSMRVWPYRIIYTIEKKIVTVTVVAIGDRKDVYKKLK